MTKLLEYCASTSPIKLPEQKVVIMEGPDGCGKTEIGNSLARQLGIPYFRMGTQHDNWRKGRFRDALELDQTYLCSFLEQTRHSVVIDRAWPSEWVYSEVFGRETNRELLFDLDVRYAQMGAHIVIPLRRDYSKVRPDELVTVEDLKKIHVGYLRFIETTRCNVTAIYVDDYEKDENSAHLSFQTNLVRSEVLSPQRKKVVIERKIIK